MRNRIAIVPDITAEILWSNQSGTVKPYAVNGIHISTDGDVSVILNDDKGEEYLIDVSQINDSFFESEDEALQANESTLNPIVTSTKESAKKIVNAMLDLLFCPQKEGEKT